MDAYWRAANYLPVGQICLYNNLPLRKSLELSHVKPQVPGTGARHREAHAGPDAGDKLIALENWL
jgi:phosphoketolase